MWERVVVVVGRLVYDCIVAITATARKKGQSGTLSGFSHVWCRIVNEAIGEYFTMSISYNLVTAKHHKRLNNLIHFDRHC